MISSKYRISKQYFPTILRNPSISGVYFRAVVVPSFSVDKPHFAVIISKKHAKLAVTRNLFRRTVYHIIHNQINKLPIKSIIFVMQKAVPFEKSILGRSSATKELSNDVKGILDQIVKKYAKNN